MGSKKIIVHANLTRYLEILNERLIHKKNTNELTITW
jgi:hypothetical protein